MGGGGSYRGVIPGGSRSPSLCIIDLWVCDKYFKDGLHIFKMLYPLFTTVPCTVHQVSVYMGGGHIPS